MTINVSNYVDNYIHYHKGRVQPIARLSNYIFIPIRDTAIADIRKAAISQEVLANMYNRGDNQSAALTLDIADQIANGTLLQSTLDGIATTLNSAIDSRLMSSNLDNFYKHALSFSTMLQHGVANTRIVKDFLNLLTYALDATGGYNVQLLSELRRFGRTVTGKNIRFNPGNAKVVSQEQLAILSKICDALANARYKFQQSGNQLSAASFRGTIVYIFRRVLGSSLADSIIARAIEDGESQVDDILTSLGFKPEQGKTIPSNTSSTVGIINTKGMSLNITQNGKTTTIEIGTDMQIANLGTVASGNVDILGTSTIGAINFGSPSARNYAYNIIAHKRQFKESYEDVYTAVAATFLRDTLVDTNKQETAQFLMVNGKVYSVLTIINNICEKYFANNQVPFGVTIEETAEGTNRWRGDAFTPNWDLAYKRSQAVNEAINVLKIGLYYNSNILNNYIDIKQ